MGFFALSKSMLTQILDDTDATACYLRTGPVAVCSAFATSLPLETGYPCATQPPKPSHNTATLVNLAFFNLRCNESAAARGHSQYATIQVPSFGSAATNDSRLL